MNKTINDKCTTPRIQAWLLRGAVGVLLMMGYQSTSWAAGSCSNTATAYTLNFGNLIIQRDAQVNTYMTDYVNGTGAAVYRGCSGFNSNQNHAIGVKSRLGSFGSVDGHNVFNSDLSGVGFILGSFGSFAGQQGCSWNQRTEIIRAGQTDQPSCIISGDGFNQNNSWILPYFRLVNTGPLSGGTLSQVIGYVWGGSASDGWLPEVPIMATGSITIAACSVVTPTVNVPLGSFFVNDFTAVGHTTTSQPVPISLNCNGGARINATITADAETSQQGTLKLTAGAGMATNVGVQILDKNGTPVALNQKFVVDTTTADGLYDFGWTARYIQTGSSVTTGPANASATMALTYE
ncbi:fimbrial protein (plasmid) [Serratia sp. AXJ-M]|uniref:fimbrial protein n=1 Tax=Serratia sp. AXJ-M TaxID=2754727 RepID=UPI00397E864F